MKSKNLIIFVLVILIIEPIFAQINISGEIRPRSEYRNGYKTLPDSISKPAFLVSQRTRLNFDYTYENIQTFISFQDVRVWGETKNKEDIASIDIHQAWAELKISSISSIKFGRQEIKYDDERLLSANNWNNIGSSHDLALLKISKSKWQTHLGLAYNNDKEKCAESNYPVKYYKTLSYLWLSRAVGSKLKISFLSIADGNQKDKSDNIIYLRSTNGINLKFENDSSRLKLFSSGYYQTGKDITGNEIDAFFISLKVNYLITKKIEPIIGLDYFSGNDYASGNSKTNRAFSNLYGSGHRFLGSMDYFTNVDVNTMGGGLIDLFGQTNYMISNKLSTHIAFHYFKLAGKLRVIDNNGNESILNNELGSEVDIDFTYKVNKKTNLQFGYSAMLPTSSMPVIKSGYYNKYVDWAWIMISVKF